MKKTMFIVFITISFLMQIQADNNALETNPTNYLNEYEKKTIAVWPFKGENQFMAKDVLYEITMNAVVQSKRLNMVEKDRLYAILQTMDLQKIEESVNSGVFVEQGQLLGAQYCLFGSVNPLEIEKKSRTNEKTGKTTYYYECKLSMSLRIVDVETGAAIYAGTVSDSSTGDTKQEAWERSSKGIVKDAKKFIKTAIPCQVSLAEILENKNGKAKTVLIEGGSFMGLEKGDHLRIFEMIPYGSGEDQKFRKKKISNIVVTEVEGDDFSVCKVKNSGNELLKKIKADATLICETYQPEMSMPRF